MKIVVFGLTITSSWGNGHATTYRSLIKALAGRGHRVLFIERDAEWYRNHCDLAEPEYCAVTLYDEWEASAGNLLSQCADADAIVIGSYYPDATAALTALRDAGHGPVLFYDIDTPITLAALRERGRTEYLEASMIPAYDAYLSFSGGGSLKELEVRYGAARAIAFYCSVDADLYRPVDRVAAFGCDLSYLGTYAADRQAKLMQLFNRPAAMLPQQEFVVAGPMYPEATEWAANVRRLSHVSPIDHPGFYSSARFTLNLTRGDMVSAGHSPSVRLFEASACGAAILSDPWVGLEAFLTPGEEILVPGDAREVVDILVHLSDEERVKMGRRARERILAEHTSVHRAAQFEEIVSRLGQRTAQGYREERAASVEAGLPR